jgi:hypothetical protein
MTDDRETTVSDLGLTVQNPQPTMKSPQSEVFSRMATLSIKDLRIVHFSR